MIHFFVQIFNLAYYVFRGEILDITEIFLLSIASSIDALSIGASCGFKGIKTSLKAKIVICVISFVVTLTAVIFGGFLRNFFSDAAGKITGGVLLIIMGIYMMISSFLNKEPVECDINRSFDIDYKEACFMGIVLSGDSFAASISVGMSGGMGFLIPVMCVIFQIAFLNFGESFAKFIAKHLNKNRFGIISGSILIITGILRGFF